LSRSWSASNLTAHKGDTVTRGSNSLLAADVDLLGRWNRAQCPLPLSLRSCSSTPSCNLVLAPPVPFVVAFPVAPLLTAAAARSQQPPGWARTRSCHGAAAASTARRMRRRISRKAVIGRAEVSPSTPTHGARRVQRHRQRSGAVILQLSRPLSARRLT
jgi:hypothetical protein